MPRTLPPDLAQAQARIERWAAEYGLEFFTTVFEILDYEEMNQVAAYGGFPTRYPHWRFGMEFERQAKGYRYGLHKIYEMVINNDPCYAYLLDVNPFLDQKMVMAHVYGHCDFFRNNDWFSRTPRKMMDQMANHAVRIRRLIDRIGLEEVEDFLDIALSLDNLIDYHAPFIARSEAELGPVGDGAAIPRAPVRFDTRGHDYMDKYINPKEFLDRQRQHREVAAQQAERFPIHPQRDALAFLIRYAPIKPWQREILEISREEAYYFAPQGMTKIMNEGWASYWHTTIMTQRELSDSEIVDFADHHSGTVAMQPGRLNPYKIGLELFRDIEERWNKGRHGKEYEECEDRIRRAAWDNGEMAGRKKIFEVRRIHNDVTFIDAFLTEDFCRRHRLFVYEHNPGDGSYVLTSRDFRRIKEALLFQLTNFGQPFIEIVDANHANRGELRLRHRHEGVDLRVDYASATLRNLHRIWQRPVLVETVVEERPIVWSFDGSEFKESAP